MSRGLVGTRLALRERRAPSQTAAIGVDSKPAPDAAPGWHKEDMPMISMALTFLIVGLVAGLLGLWGVAAMASQIAWVLFLIGVVLLVLHMIGARRLPPAV